MLRFVLYFGESSRCLVWGLGAQNLSGLVLLSCGQRRGEGEPWRPPSSSTWHASRFSNSPGLDLGFGRRTFSRLKGRGPTSNPFFLHPAAQLFFPHPLIFVCLLGTNSSALQSLENEN